MDSGLLAALKGIDGRVLQRDRQQLGSIFECFVYSEFVKALALSDERIDICHYRDKDQVEVDLVLVRSPGEVVGVEIKARVTIRPSDFKLKFQSIFCVSC